MKKVHVLQSMIVFSLLLFFIVKLPYAQDLSTPDEEELFEMIEYDINGACLSSNNDEEELPFDDYPVNYIGSGLSSSFTFSGINNIDEVVVTRTVNTPNKSSFCGGGGFSGNIGAIMPPRNLIDWYLNLNKPKQPINDPCAGRTSVNEKLNKSEIDSLNKVALDNTKNRKIEIDNRQRRVEWGYETKLNSLTSTEMINSAIRNGGRKNFTPEFSWNSIDGYVTGVTHTHPSNSPPSPSDIYHFSGWLNNIPKSDHSFFANNFTSTIITKNYTYVVKIKNLEEYAKLYNNTKAAFDTEYQKISEEYRREIVKQDDIFDSQEYALLKMFGDAVTIYKAKNDKKGLDFKPLKLNTYNIPTVDNCK